MVVCSLPLLGIRRRPLSHHLEPCKAQEQLFFTHVAEADGGLHIVASALYTEHITDTETFMLNYLSRLQATAG